MKGAHKEYLICIFSTKTQKMWAIQFTLRPTFEPYNLIKRFITTQNVESGRNHTLTLEGESFQFYGRWWEKGVNMLKMIWSWENEETFDELQLLATKLIELIIGPVAL